MLATFSCTKESWGGYNPDAEFIFVEKVADVCILRPVALISYLDTLYSDTSLTFKDGSSFILNYNNGDRIGPLTMTLSADKDTVWTYCDESFTVARNDGRWAVRRNEKHLNTVFTFDYSMEAEPVDDNLDGIRDGWKIRLEGRRLEDGDYYMTYRTMDDYLYFRPLGHIIPRLSWTETCVLNSGARTSTRITSRRLIPNQGRSHMRPHCNPAKLS